MKKILSAILILSSILLIFNPIGASAQDLNKDVQDSTKATISYEDINLILKIFDGQQPDDVILKAEMLINTSKSEEEMIFIAKSVYDYYRNSKIMGYDEVAIYFAENYFLNGKLNYQDEDKLMEMRLFSEFNKRSLIGMKAEELTLQDPAGRNISILNGNQDYTILYFYDDQCPNCIRFTPALYQYLIKDSDIRYSVYFIYTQDDRERWINYIEKMRNLFNLPENVKLTHLWDPDMSSEFPVKYGVISTPKLFLLDRDDIIIGRSLTPNALAQVVEIEQNQMNETERLFEQIFVPLASSQDSTVITREIDGFYNDSKDNVPFFNELFYTLYQYLKTSSYYTLQQAAAYLANNYIIGKKELWKDVEFTNKGVTKGNVIRGDYDSVNDFLDETELGLEMFYRNMLNRPATDLKLKNIKNKNVKLSSIEAEYTILYFYSFDCKLCNAVSEDLLKMCEEYKDKNVKFVAISTDANEIWPEKSKETENGSWINLWDPKKKSKMFDKYDILDVPAIYLLDKDRKVLAKDINPDVLASLLEYYTENEDN